jgi:hypothetical protein
LTIPCQFDSFWKTFRDNNISCIFAKVGSLEIDLEPSRCGMAPWLGEPAPQHFRGAIDTILI